MNINVINLAKLYDCVARELNDAMSNQKIAISYNDDRLKTKVKWLGEIAKTLSLVYQIEKLRAKPGTEAQMPEVQEGEDPALKRAQGQQKGTTNQQPFDGGWTPFQ